MKNCAKIVKLKKKINFEWILCLQKYFIFQDVQSRTKSIDHEKYGQFFIDKGKDFFGKFTLNFVYNESQKRHLR